MKHLFTFFWQAIAFIGMSGMLFAQSLPLDFEVPEDDAWGGFNGTVATVVTDPTDGTNTVLEMAGAGVDFDGASIALDTYIDLSDDANNTISMRIWAPDATLRTHLLKLEGGSSGATELTFTTSMMGWQTVNVDFGGGLGTEYPTLVIFTDSTPGNTATGTYYIDDIDGPNGAVVPVDVVPPTAAPVPTNPDGLVYSFYNDTNGYTTNFPIVYAFGTSQGDEDLGGNNALKMNFSVAGWGQGEGGPDDVSAYNFLNFNYWADAGVPGFRIVLIDNDGAVEEFVYEVGTNEAIVNESWQTVSIPMSYFTGLGFDATNLFQWKLDPFMQSMAQGGLVYFDNILLTTNALSTSDRNLNAQSVQLYPNPAIKGQTVQFSQELSNLEVYNMQGQKVKVAIGNSFSTQGLSSGVYVVRGTTKDNQIVSKKLIVR